MSHAHFPSILRSASLGTQPFGDSWGQDWVTYELNQPLLSPRPLQSPVLWPAVSCPLVPLYIVSSEWLKLSNLPSSSRDHHSFQNLMVSSFCLINIIPQRLLQLSWALPQGLCTTVLLAGHALPSGHFFRSSLSAFFSETFSAITSAPAPPHSQPFSCCLLTYSTFH